MLVICTSKKKQTKKTANCGVSVMLNQSYCHPYVCIYIGQSSIHDNTVYYHIGGNIGGN